MPIHNKSVGDKPSYQPLCSEEKQDGTFKLDSRLVHEHQGDQVGSVQKLRSQNNDDIWAIFADD